MNYREYVSVLKTQTSTLTRDAQLKFAVLICKKLYFDYQRFSEVYNWGDHNLLMDAILVCEQVIDNRADINQVKELLPKVDLIMPHMDDFRGDDLAHML